MDRELYLVTRAYNPNTASMNRFMAFAKGYGENGIKTTVIFLSDSSLKVSEEYKNVSFIYLYDRCKYDNKYINYLLTLISLFKFINKNIPVIFYGSYEFIFLFRLKRNVKIYHERTEHPYVCKIEGYGPFGRILQSLYLHTCKRLNGMFVISPALYDYFINIIKVPRNKIHIINMVVDQKRFINVSNNPESNYISYCGTASMYKDGVDVLIKSFAQIHKIYPNLKLRIIGPFMSKKDETELLNLCSSLNLKQYIDFTGKIPASQMPNMLSNSKILVLSRPDNKQAKYGFPTKLGEYLMSGVPVLVTRVGDIDKYLKDKESIIFATPNSVDDFTKSLDWILGNYDKALKIAENGKSIAQHEFNYLLESNKVIKYIFGS